MPTPDLAEILHLLRCPSTGEPLICASGRLSAANDVYTYPVKDGVPFLVPDDADTPALVDELLRYRRFFARYKDGLYESHRVTQKIEEVKVTVELYKVYFNSIVSELDFSGGPLVLDTGAGMMETSYELSRRGGRVVATDLSPVEIFNPRIYSFFETEGYDWNDFSITNGARAISEEELDFHRVIAATEKLPFADNSFDIVFTRSSLHHLKDVNRGLAEMARVLKPGGKLAVTGECIRPLWEKKGEYLDHLIDYQEGIDEQMRTWRDYHGAMKAAGLADIQVKPLLASSGKKLPRVFARLGRRDPFNKLEGRTIAGARLPLLHAMGCVVGWLATKPAASRSAAKPATAPPAGTAISDLLLDIESNQETLRTMALAANSHVAKHYHARQLPQPACIGFGLLHDSHATPWRPMFQTGRLIAGGGVARGKITLQIDNAEQVDAALRFTLFPGNITREATLKPGANTLKLDFGELAESPSWEIDFAFETQGDRRFRTFTLG